MDEEKKYVIFVLLGIVIGFFTDILKPFDYLMINALIMVSVFVLSTYYVGFSEVQKDDLKKNVSEREGIKMILSKNHAGINEVVNVGVYGGMLVTILISIGTVISSGMFAVTKVGFGAFVVAIFLTLVAMFFGWISGLIIIYFLNFPIRKIAGIT